jgi:hypothetical protein
MADTFSSGIVGLRPRPDFTFPNLFNPSLLRSGRATT